MISSILHCEGTTAALRYVYVLVSMKDYRTADVVIRVPRGKGKRDGLYKRQHQPRLSDVKSPRHSYNAATIAPNPRRSSK